MQRRPSGWSDAQRTFRHAYARDGVLLPRTRVHWRASPPTAVSSHFKWGRVSVVAAVVRVLYRLLSGATLSTSPVISIWLADAAPGSGALLIFDVLEMPATVEGDGCIVGECSINGALCLELDGGHVLWPTYNPRQPAFNAQRL